VCGIGGFFVRHPVANQAITDTFRALSRRGPDAQHMTSWNHEWAKSTSAPSKALLHTRLSIRDPRPEADQPMSNQNEDVWICYNGEVYGWEQEAKQLINSGYHFKTHSDTEFILHAYEEWGLTGMIERLRGMFALAILDLRENKLYLIRDRMGLKPVLYHYDPATGDLIFASLVRAIIPILSPDKCQFSVEGIDAYLAHRYIPAPKTIFQHIHRLENGHLLTYDLHSRELEKKRYWHPEASNSTWQTTLDEAIQIRLASDRPVGMFLSGGMDSGIIASRLATLETERIPHAFTAAFPGTSWDESNEARRLAHKLDIPFTSYPITMRLDQDFPRIIEDLDEPIASPSSIPSWYLSQNAVKKVTVVLSGDGGDELFGGYKRYAQHLRTSWHGNYRIPLPLLNSYSPKGWRKILAESSMNWIDAYSLRFSGFTPNQRKYLQPDISLRNHYWRLPEGTSTFTIEHLLQIDIENYLPEYVLRTSDLCTMAHGLEMRAPLIDHQFYQSILSVPKELRFTSPSKSLFLSYAEEASTIIKRKKRGFNPPLEKWLNQDLVERFDGLDNRLDTLTNGQLSSTSCRKLINSFLDGKDYLAEQALQLLMLDESLMQLQDLQ